MNDFDGWIKLRKVKPQKVKPQKWGFLEWSLAVTMVIVGITLTILIVSS